MKNFKYWFWKVVWNHELFYASVILLALVVAALLIYGQFVE